MRVKCLAQEHAGGAVASWLVGLGSSPGRGHCDVFLVYFIVQPNQMKTALPQKVASF